MQGTAIFRVPDGLADGVACPASCATATVAAAIEAAGPIAGRAVLVIGAGMLGVTAAAWTRALGASEVLVCDPDAGRLASAMDFGATGTATPAGLGEAVAAATNGRGADVVLEFSGSSEAVGGALPRIRTGGTLVLVGSVFPSDPVAVPPERIVRGCLTIRGIHNYAPAHLGQAVAFLAANARTYPFESLVSGWHPLSGIDVLVGSDLVRRAMRVGVRPEAIKGVQ